MRTWHTDDGACSQHPSAGDVRACASCGGEHPITEDDGCIVYYDCIPGVTKAEFLEAALAAGLAPKRDANGHSYSMKCPCCGGPASIAEVPRTPGGSGRR